MGTELEWKLRVPAPALQEEILAWEEIRRRMTEPLRLLRMQTSYYDTPDRRLSAARITLRRRLENGVPVFCVKTPLADAENPNLRGEWEVAGEPELAASLPRLIALGAPADLPEAGELRCLYGAKFLRRAVLLDLGGASTGELALDLGTLLGPSGSRPLCELELELKSGGPTPALELVRALQARFGLEPEPKSKLARAMEL